MVGHGVFSFIFPPAVTWSLDSYSNHNISGAAGETVNYNYSSTLPNDAVLRYIFLATSIQTMITLGMFVCEIK